MKKEEVTMTEAVAVLAGGVGSRFLGRKSKLLTEFRGRPMVSWVLEAALWADVDEYLVVTGAVELGELIPDDFHVLHNGDWKRGMATSLQVAIRWCKEREHEGLTVGLGDQPGVLGSAWRIISDARELPISVASYGGKRRNPVRLEKAVWDMVPDTGDEGARAVMREHPELVQTIECEGDPFDIDTMEDLRRWS